MARADKSALITAAVEVYQKREFTNYKEAAKRYSCDRTAVSRRIRGFTKTRREAQSFWFQALTDS